MSKDIKHLLKLTIDLKSIKDCKFKGNTVFLYSDL